MRIDSVYTNGVIAVKENALLKDKIFKLCEAGADEVLRTITESGFGKGAEAESVYEYEKLVAADDKDIDAFIRGYAPDTASLEYFLSPRDFHNAKALVKAEFLNLDAEKMLAPEGLVPVAVILECIKNADYSALNPELAWAVKEAVQVFTDEEKNKNGVSGAAIGVIFDKAQYKRLAKVCAKNGVLKKLVQRKADMLNILTAMRSQTPEYAADNYVGGGKLTAEQLSKLFNDDKERAASALDGTELADFVKVCFAQKNEGLPLTEAERLFDGVETDCLAKNRYEMKGSQPFLYYVLRRRAENANVRILFVCLLAGMKEQDIKNRLRAI